MKKTLLAAALLAGFAGVAQAETSVTLYGIIDTGIGYNKVKGTGYDASRVGMMAERLPLGPAWHGRSG
ncbi:outer membrane porin protein [Bordetella avium]|nr:outer membrane porin protein [Bordetella avium]